MKRTKKTSTYYKSKPYRARTMLAAVRTRARNKNLEYDLDPEWLLEKFEIGVCDVTGLPLVFDRTLKYSMHPSTPSVDRIDPRRGYTKDNCQVVCAAINYMMGQYPTHLTRVYARAFLKATDGEYDGPSNN